jgi:predicted negative regulator of RcsB-dependent stress response
MNIKDLTKKQLQTIVASVLIVVVILISVIVVEYNRHENTKDNALVATMYQKAILVNENANTTPIDKEKGFKQIATEYPRTSYGIFASWQLANMYVSTTDSNTSFMNYQATVNYTKAISVLSDSIQQNPNNNLSDISKTRLAKLYIATNQSKKAIALLQNDNLTSAYPLMILGQAYSQSGNQTEAIQVWQRALQDRNISPQFLDQVNQLINNSK